METKASGRLDVYNPGEAGERLLKQRPEVSEGMASCDHSTPGAIAGSDLQLPVEKTHLFSDADALLEAPQSSTLRSSGAHTYLASNRSLPCKRSATGNKSQDRTAPFGSQTPGSNKGRPLCRLSCGLLVDHGTHKFGRRVHETHQLEIGGPNLIAVGWLRLHSRRQGRRVPLKNVGTTGAKATWRS